MLKIHELRVHRCSGKSVKNISALIFYILLQCWVKFRTQFAHLMPSCKCEFHEKGSVKDTGLLYLMVKWVYIHTVYIYNTIWIKLCARYMHMILSVFVSSMKTGAGMATLLQWGYWKYTVRSKGSWTEFFTVFLPTPSAGPRMNYVVETVSHKSANWR